MYLGEKNVPGDTSRGVAYSEHRLPGTSPQNIYEKRDVSGKNVSGGAWHIQNIAPPGTSPQNIYEKAMYLAKSSRNIKGRYSGKKRQIHRARCYNAMYLNMPRPPDAFCPDTSRFSPRQAMYLGDVRNMPPSLKRNP